MTNGFYATVELHGISFLVYMRDGIIMDVVLADIFSANNKSLLRCLNAEAIKTLSTCAAMKQINGEVEYADS